MKNCFKIDSNSAQCEVDYFLRDHLGSVRVVVDGTGKVQEWNDYYSFGARHVRSDYPQLTANRWKYNSKEDQVTGDLKYLDYGARMYDSGLGRWFGMDPKAEKFYGMSPYCYVLNNPLLLIDPDGELPALVIPIGGAFVVIGVMDMVLIGLGVAASGAVLRNAFDQAGIELTDELADFWTNTLNIIGVKYAAEYLRNEGKEWQDRKGLEAEYLPVRIRCTSVEDPVHGRITAASRTHQRRSGVFLSREENGCDPTGCNYYSLFIVDSVRLII